MKWRADQQAGYFGFTPPPAPSVRQQLQEAEMRRQGLTVLPPPPPQPRWMEQVDIAEACEAASDIMEVFKRCLAWPDAQPFSGGVWDAWPARLSDGLAFCRGEWAAVVAFLKHEAEAKHE